MATVTATYAPAAGRQAVTLTGWAGGAVFSVTPTAGSQIEAVDTLTIDDKISGPDGTYRVHHIQSNGNIESADFVIDSSISLNGDFVSGFVVVNLSGEITADPKFATQPVSGGQLWLPATGITSDTQLNITADIGSHLIYYVSPTGLTEGLNYTVTADVEVGTGTAAYQVDPLTHYVATLGSTIEPLLFTDWPRQPVAGEQLISEIANGQFNSEGSWTGETEGIFNIWFIANNGQIYGNTIDTEGLPGKVTITLVKQFEWPDTVTTLAEPIDHFVDGDWASQSEAGEQLVYNSAQMTIDSGFNISSELQEIIPFIYINNDGMAYGRSVDSRNLQAPAVEFEVAEEIFISSDAAFEKTSEFELNEELAISTAVAFEKTSEFELNEDITFDFYVGSDGGLVNFSVANTIQFDTNATQIDATVVKAFYVAETIRFQSFATQTEGMSKTAFFEINENINFSSNAVFKVPSEIISGGDSNSKTDIVTKSSHVLTVTEETEIIDITQNAWRQLEFPITVNGVSPIDVEDVRFVIYSDGVLFRTFEQGAELQYIDGSIILVLDETFTITLDKHFYQFELWFNDSNEDPFFVMSGELRVKHTKVRFL